MQAENSLDKKNLANLHLSF